MNNEIKGLKISSGEEVIGKVREEPDYYVVDNPVMVIAVPEGIGMLPWPQWSDGRQIKVLKSHITTCFVVNPKIIDGYNQKFGGIVTASAGMLNQLDRR